VSEALTNFILKTQWVADKAELNPYDFNSLLQELGPTSPNLPFPAVDGVRMVSDRSVSLGDIRVSFRNTVVFSALNPLPVAGVPRTGVAAAGSGSVGTYLFSGGIFEPVKTPVPCAPEVLICECGKDKHGFASHSTWCKKYAA
jgi:hypothetical protein